MLFSRYAQPCAGLFALLVVAAGLIDEAQAQEMRDIIHTATLENGLDVIVIPDSTVPIVTIELTVKNGAYTETDELNGLSHLYEHMFFKGNAVIPNQEAYLKRMNELGIVFNGTTSAERVNYFFTLPKANLDEGLEFMRDAALSPIFDEAEFEAEKQVVLGEVDRNESNPGYWLWRGINQLLWYEYPARKDPLGERETILAATTEQMRTMQATYYVPNNSVLLVAGDVEFEEALELVDEVFGQWERGADPFEEDPVPPHPPLEESAFTIVEQPTQIAVFQFGWHGPSVNEDPEATYAADVLSYILAQPASRFQQRLVESRVTLGASMSYGTLAFTGPATVSAQTTAANLREAIRATLIEVKALSDPDYYTDEQLEAAKTMLTVSDIYSREQTSSFARTVTYWWAVAGVEYYLDYVANLQAVTRQDIANFVEKYIQDEPFVLGVLISKEQREELGLTEEELAQIVDEIRQELAAEGGQP